MKDEFYDKRNRLFDSEFYTYAPNTCVFWMIVDYNWSAGEQAKLESVAELMDYS